MIKTNIQYFTDDTAREWVASDHLDKTILLISDIRTGEPDTQTPEKVEELYKPYKKYTNRAYTTVVKRGSKE